MSISTSHICALFQESLFHLLHGKQIGMGNDVCISTDNGENWKSMGKFLVRKNLFGDKIMLSP